MQAAAAAARKLSDLRFFYLYSFQFASNLCYNFYNLVSFAKILSQNSPFITILRQKAKFKYNYGYSVPLRIPPTEQKTEPFHSSILSEPNTGSKPSHDLEMEPFRPVPSGSRTEHIPNEGISTPGLHRCNEIKGVDRVVKGIDRPVKGVDLL